MLIDTHAHLNFNAYKDDADEVIRRALNNGVWMINVGSQYKTSKRAVEIAEKYKAKAEDIISFNDLLNENDIFIGDILIVPDGKMPTPKIEYAPQSQEVPIANGYFICPISSPCQITQGLHWYNAVDLSHGKCGEPVFAAAGGKVIKVKYGWSGGAGNNVSISHLNGAVVTVYYHLQNILVFPGQEVLIGEQIGTIGNTGRSTGCHLHFGVVGAKNPFPK